MQWGLPAESVTKETASGDLYVSTGHLLSISGIVALTHNMYRSPTTTVQPYQTLAVNLDVDVFFLILKFLPCAGLLQMRLASQFAEQEATKEFLARPVWMPWTRRLGAFCKFVLAPSKPDRPCYLQSLQILNIPNRQWH